MARIVKLGELLPEDIAFEMPDGSQILAPGDPPLQLILKIASLFERVENAGKDGQEVDPNLGVEVMQELDAEVLALLQMRNPDMTTSPFGIVGVQRVVATLLEAYGFGIEDGEDEDPPPAPARSRKPKSPPSSGSPRSSTSSTSRRTTGGR